jgi:hypothetical protein
MVLRELGTGAAVLMEPGPKAMMPYRLEIH